jgi:hypothetical protein
MIPPRHLVLSGGGIKVVSIVGALRVLEEKGLLRNIKSVSGVSAGAWLAFMISAGLTIKVIEKMVLELEFGVIRNISPYAFIGFPETYGIDDGSNLRKFLESILKIVLKIEPNSTFSCFASNKIQFRCWASDINTRTSREFSLEKTPSVKIIDALHASMAIPLYFTPVIDPVTGHLLSDGGIQGTLPIHNLTDIECEQCIAIGFCRGKPFPEDGVVPDDLMGFIQSVFASLMLRNKIVVNKWEHKIIRIPVDEFPSWNFEASREERLELVKKGSNAMKEWIHSKGGSRMIKRRVSY